MDGLPAILIGLVFAVLILYWVRPVKKIEAYVQQPIRKGSPIDEQNELLIAVGLQTRYVAAPPSVMDESTISQDEWLKAQRSTLGVGPPSAPVIQEAPVDQMIPMAGGFSSTPWSGGGGGVTVPIPAIEQLVTPQTVTTGGGAALAPAPAGAPAARVLSPAEIQAQQAAARDEAYRKQLEADALRADTAAARAKQDAVNSLRLSYINDFKNRWLTSADNRTTPKVTTDTAATRSAYVAWLQSKYDQDRLTFDTNLNPRETDAVKIELSNNALKDFETRQAAINALGTTWQNSTTVDCYPKPWGTTSNNIADVPTGNYEVAVECTKECDWGTMTARAKYEGPMGDPPGAACPPVDQRIKKNFNCKKADCETSRSPATAQCAYQQGYEYASVENKCVKPIPADFPNWTMAQNGCPPPSVYTATASASVGGVLGVGATTYQGACVQTGRNNFPVTCPGGYTWNNTRKRCELSTSMDPTWTCGAAATLGTGARPDCIAKVPSQTRKGNPYMVS